MFAYLHFFFAPSCDACEAAEPDLVEFEQRNKSVIVVRRNALAYNRVEATPYYLLNVDGRFVASHEGMMTLAQLEKFVGKHNDLEAK